MSQDEIVVKGIATLKGSAPVGAKRSAAAMAALSQSSRRMRRLWSGLIRRWWCHEREKANVRMIQPIDILTQGSRRTLVSSASCRWPIFRW